LGRLGKTVLIFPGSSQKRAFTMKITQASLAALKIPEGKSDYIIFDEAMPGFGVRLRAGGKSLHRTFIAQYKIGAKHRRMNLGNVAKVRLDDAKDEAKKIFGRVANGEDPAAQKTAAREDASRTLGAIVAQYLEAKSDRRRHDSLRYQLERLWGPLHGLALGAINRATVATRINAIASGHGPVAANRARSTLSSMYRWAIGEGLYDVNPVIGTNKREESGPRERALSDEEAAALWIATKEDHFGRIVRLLMLTGCRRDEIGSLRWSEIDINARTITLPKERTKNGREHVVPLTESAMEILAVMPRIEGRDYVFGLRGGGFSNWSQAKKELDKATELKPWALHDLRRTVRTGLGMLGVLPHVAEAVLNHLPAKLIRTYDRNTYTAEKRDALERWANHLAVAIAQASGTNVTRLPSNQTA
jgi:integrase